LHTHIIVNAVSFETGKKLHLNDSAYRNCKDLADKMGAELGFTPLMWREKTVTDNTEKRLSSIMIKAFNYLHFQAIDNPIKH